MPARAIRQAGPRTLADYVGGIEHESSLLVANERGFPKQFAVDCRTGCEVVGISAADKTIEPSGVATGTVTSVFYAKLLSTEDLEDVSSRAQWYSMSPQ